MVDECVQSTQRTKEDTFLVREGYAIGLFLRAKAKLYKPQKNSGVHIEDFLNGLLCLMHAITCGYCEFNRESKLPPTIASEKHSAIKVNAEANHLPLDARRRSGKS